MTDVSDGWDVQAWIAAVAELPLTPAQKVTAAGLASFADPVKGTAKPGRRALATRTRISPSGVWASLRRLEQLGAIKRTGSAALTRAAEYQLVLPVEAR